MMKHSTAVLAVADVPQAVDFYERVLGFSKRWLWGDPPTFGCVGSGETEIFMNRQPELASLSASGGTSRSPRKMCTGRYVRSSNVVSVSTASKTRSTSPVDDVNRSFPVGPQARRAARQVRRGDSGRAAPRT